MEKLPDWRFLVIGDKETNAEGKQYAFFFKEKGTDEAIKTLVQAFLESVTKDHGTVKGWGAKRLMVFFKRYVEREHQYHIQGILDFTTKDLLENLIDFQCASFMLLMSDTYDENGFPLLQTISLDNTEKPKDANPAQPNRIILLNRTVMAPGVWFHGGFSGQTKVGRPYKFSAYAVSDQEKVLQLFRISKTPIKQGMGMLAHKFGEIEDEQRQLIDHGHMVVDSAAVLFIDTLIPKVVAVFFDIDIHVSEALLMAAFAEIIAFAQKEQEVDFLKYGAPAITF